MKQFFFSLSLMLALICIAPPLTAQTNTLSVKLDDETRSLLREAMEDKWFKKDVLVSTVLGGALAIVGGFAGISWQQKLQRQDKKKEDAEFTKNVLLAIRRELEAIGDIYDAGIGEKLKQLPEGEIFRWRLGLTQNWFSVFESNALHLGRIDGDISRQIVTVYILAKGLIEEYRINNDYQPLLSEAECEFNLHRGDNLISGRLENVRKLMASQAKNIREREKNLKIATQHLYTLLDQRGIK